MNQIADRFQDNDEDDNCECACHDGGYHEYRLMRGSSIEGISIREVVIDKDGDVAQWSFPISEPVASAKEAEEDLETTIKELTDVREAFTKPMLDEAALESEMEEK